MADKDNYTLREGALGKFLTNPSAVATIIVAVVGQALFTGVYQIRTNDRLEARIEANEIAVRELRARVRDISEHSEKVDQQVINKIDSLDSHGTRQLDNVKITQERVLSNVDKINERMTSIDKRLNEVENRGVILHTEVTNLVETINKFDERMNRIVQALDNTYNLLEEYIKLNPSKTPLKSQSPVK